MTKSYNVLATMLMLLALCVCMQCTSSSNQEIKNQDSYVKEIDEQAIKDWPRISSVSQFTLILFYVPWSANCIQARNAFKEVASVSKNNSINFLSVNCWKRELQCESNFSITQWPSVTACIRGRTCLHYNGYWSAQHLLKFVNALLNPYVRLQNKEMLKKMQDLDHLYWVVGFFDQVGTEEYFNFALTAYKWLEVDPRQMVRFAVYLQRNLTGTEEHGCIEIPCVLFVNARKSQLHHLPQRLDVGKLLESLKIDDTLSCNLAPLRNRLQMLTYALSAGYTVISMCNNCTQKQQHLLDLPAGTMELEEELGLSKQELTLNTAYLLLDSAIYQDFWHQITGEANQILPQERAVITIAKSSEEVILLNYMKLSQKMKAKVVPKEVSVHPPSADSHKSNSNTSKEVSVSIKELYWHNFEAYMSQQNCTVVAMIYSPECAMCSLLSNILLQISVKLSDERVSFVRLNANTHKLPLIYNIDYYPTLLVFPRGKLEDSKMFPRRLKLNYKNILLFILSQLDATEQMAAVAGLCAEYPSSISRNCVVYVARVLLKEPTV